MSRFKIAFPYLLLGLIVLAVGVSNLPVGGRGAAGARDASPICGPCGMAVAAENALTAEIGGRRRHFCSRACRERALTEPVARAAAPGGRWVDVVCHMEVNAVWNIRAEHAGRTYYFCAERCRRLFEADPRRYLASKCPVCGTPLASRPTFAATYLDKTYELCSPEHRILFKQDPAAYFMHTMWGIPAWLYYASIALVLVVSFGLFDWLGRRTAGESIALEQSRAEQSRADQSRDREGAVFVAEPRSLPHDRGFEQALQSSAQMGKRTRHAMGGAGALTLPIVSAPALSKPRRRHAVPHRLAAERADRFDLLSIGWIDAALRSRVFRFVLQALFVAAFLVILAAGLFGNQNPALNIAPILTWTIWWALLIVLILFAGKAWCYVCPWDALAGWAEKLGPGGFFGFLKLWKKSDDGLSLGLRWPRIVRNISIATILFIGLTWIELGFGVTMKPRITAYLAIAMLLMAVVSALLFDRKSFCRYGCLVGRVSGLYALFAGTEVRPRSRGVCEACRSKECVRGSETAYGCPTFLYPGRLETNTYCIQCMECVQACPHDNLAVNLRPWGSDLAVEGRPRTDEAYLALLMLSITGFHGLTMTPAWGRFIEAIRASAGVGRVLGFSLGMAALMLAPILIYALLVGVSKRLGDGPGARAGARLRYRDYFIRYAYALLPIALFYHIAHNLEHLLMEGPKVVAMASDPFGWNWNLFGTAGWTIPPMISLEKLWLIQVLLVLVGHVYSLWVAQKTSLRLFASRRAAFRSQLPMLFGMICFSVFSLWLLKQPMEMRTSAM